MIASTSTGADADAVLAGAVLDDPPVTPPNEGDGAPPAGFAFEPSAPVATAPDAALEILDHIFPKMLMRYLAVREGQEGLTVGKDGAGIAGPGKARGFCRVGIQTLEREEERACGRAWEAGLTGHRRSLSGVWEHGTPEWEMSPSDAAAVSCGTRAAPSRS